MTAAAAAETKTRSNICLACRTLFEDGATCPGKGHVTVSLAGDERKLLDDEVWGPDSRARQMKRAARAGAGGVGVGSLLQGCDACGATPFDACELGSGAGEAALAVIAFVIAAIVFAGVAILLFYLIRAIVRWIRDAMHRPQPHGALLEAPKPKNRAVAARGVVRAGTPILNPWRAGSSFAYAMELYQGRVFGGGAMLRDAATAGFEVALDDGRTLLIPPGRIRLLGNRSRVDHVDKDRLNAFIDTVDPKKGLTDRTLFPCDYARVLTIEPGDRVELVGETETSSEEAAVGYRQPGGRIVPVGVPMLRVHKAAQPEETKIRVADLPTAAAAAEDQDEAVLSEPGPGEEVEEEPKRAQMRREEPR